MPTAPGTGLSARTIPTSTRGRIAALLALLAVTALIAATAFSIVTFAKDKKKAKSASAPKSVASKNVRRNNSPKRVRAEKGRRGEVAERRRERDREREGFGRAEPERERYEALLEQEEYWATRLTYPTGEFSPTWVSEARKQDAEIERAVPSSNRPVGGRFAMSPLSLSPTGFTALGPAPERMTGCSGCFDYGLTAGRVNSIAIDPTTTTNGSIVAYIATVGGGVWKSTNCCTSTTSWVP